MLVFRPPLLVNEARNGAPGSNLGLQSETVALPRIELDCLLLLRLL
jgi:hypothetical protein